MIRNILLSFHYDSILISDLIPNISWIYQSLDLSALYMHAIQFWNDQYYHKAKNTFTTKTIAQLAWRINTIYRYKKILHRTSYLPLSPLFPFCTVPGGLGPTGSKEGGPGGPGSPMSPCTKNTVSMVVPKIQYL